MVTFDPLLMTFLDPSGDCYERDRWAVREARRLYEQACSRGRWNRLWRWVTRQPRHLLTLTSIEAISTPQTHHYLGIQMVPLKQISGSEGRSTDFDVLFYPSQQHSQERWLSIAAARLLELSLPPIELMQVGEDYFVWDGHHRISVARALGEQYIEAEVTVRQVYRPSPGKQAVSLPLPHCPAISALITAKNLD